MLTEQREALKARLKEMGRVFRSLPNEDLKWLADLQAAWPDAPAELLSLKDRADQIRTGDEQRVRVLRAPPMPDEIDRADETFYWLISDLNKTWRKVTFAWALGFPMKGVAQNLHLSTRGAWRVLDSALERLEGRL